MVIYLKWVSFGRKNAFEGYLNLLRRMSLACLGPFVEPVVDSAASLSALLALASECLRGFPVACLGLAYRQEDKSLSSNF